MAKSNNLLIQDIKVRPEIQARVEMSDEVVDAYADRAVLSCHSAGLNPFMEAVVRTLGECGMKAVYEKSAGETRRKEGLPDAQGFLGGEEPFPWEFREGKARFRAHPDRGQKTGFYLDFRPARRRVFETARGIRVLDAFCYQGATSIQAVLGGASSVLALDSSEEALRLGREDARLNGVEDVCEFRRADCFDALQEMSRSGDAFDLVVLDPPPLARSVHDLPKAGIAMRRLMAQGMNLLRPGGRLLAAACSHHMDWRILEEAVAGACGGSGRRFILAERLFQPPDHPVLVGVPETEYLRAVILQEVRS